MHEFDLSIDDAGSMPSRMISTSCGRWRNCLSSERDAAIEECRRMREENHRLHHLLRQLQRAAVGRRLNGLITSRMR